MIAVIIIIVILVVLGIIFAGVYNSLVGRRNQVDNSWSQIEVQLKRRHDLIPNLVEAVKDYMSYEQETLTCLLYTSPSPRDRQKSRMPSSA